LSKRRASVCAARKLRPEVGNQRPRGRHLGPADLWRESSRRGPTCSMYRRVPADAAARSMICRHFCREGGNICGTVTRLTGGLGSMCDSARAGMLAKVAPPPPCQTPAPLLRRGAVDRSYRGRGQAGARRVSICLPRRTNINRHSRQAKDGTSIGRPTASRKEE